MRSLLIGIAVVGMMAMPALADVWTGDPTLPGFVNPSVGFSVNIVPWVHIILNPGPLVINIPPGGNSGSATLGGSVTTNVDVSLTAEITEYPVMPDGYEIDRSSLAEWTAEISPESSHFKAGFEGTMAGDNNFLTVSVSGIPSTVIAGNMTGGIVTITIIPD